MLCLFLHCETAFAKQAQNIHHPLAGQAYKLKIGIIETGKPSETLAARFGNYPEMFTSLIGNFLPEAIFFTKSVVSGERVGNPDQADGWLITGSRHGVYDDHLWINALEKFIQQCLKNGVPLIGVCFGHQIIAQAMGGKVCKSNKGWGVGVQKYSVSNKPDWMSDLRESYCSHAIHQDQILDLPADTTVFSSSGFCNYAALFYGNAALPKALTVQSHPELSADFVRQISKERLSKIVPADVLAAGLAPLGMAVNNEDWGKVFAQYFQRMTKARAEKP